MLRVALTGGIASGKSVVTDLFEKLGAEVIDTDLISRELVEPGNPLLKQICELFGEDILDESQALDRAKLRQRIFNNNEERIALEELLHPAIRQRVYERIAESDADYVIVAIPLLTETRYPYELDRILVVDAPRQQQLERLVERDKLSGEAARKMVEAQSDREVRLAVADDIITNDDSIYALKQKVEELHKHYTRLSQATTSE
ncbi:dephospho-CoA kinase [Solemya velum gill symbiont]|uniref:dephospho-CoA kinase n=1 Tax=Solemya velum gill symbiont TaxID=2340 RepID=UPI000997AFB2|nr:dephospho-CoA kinase [Solemya velum gill symbiont]OOZ00229.1 dephospho-CoA kinase [Solemya velum gill symbiont]OOZ02387.1 dephospho-CoA kinase [Solemya velum gill symbiont]OOZ04744.1 dephospho-CoA kinase [Solemya velum gill symbiont]OOZ06983.1 dephospho-CoA kinase [Solemya velum gill symbiont]OOZ09166.1 dephospho-CoA kinase [Solemya velum gill symbiont]